MPDLVFELGTEEMPSGAIASALDQLRSLVTKGLAEARLSPSGAEAVRTAGTPRRLIVTVAGLPERQSDETREVRGPSASVAYDAAGNPTGAAVGFARKQGIAVEALERVSTPQGEYIQARVTAAGKPAVEVLGPLLAEAVRALTFPKMMRWGSGAIRFVRPIRWICCLLDREVVPLEIAGVASGRLSRGHRFLAPAEFEVAAAGDLLPRLHDVFVMTDPEERRAAIREQADALAAKAGGRIPWDEGLLDENTWLVEWPTAVLGTFEERFLALPRPILVTAMKKHQRYFPVEGPDGRILNNFVAIRSGGDAHLDLVREGYEHVLTARFSDAAYFHDQDKAVSLDEMAAQLDRLLFQEKLGTIAQKRERLIRLIGDIADSRSFSLEERAAAVRAAQLAKADLVSRVVIELPALQGIVGREYALVAGEDTAVADALAEQYQPKGAGDAPPASALGRLLALSDRLDTLVGYVGIGILPSGSSDPYGLRRAAQGVVQLLADDPAAPSLREMEVQAARAFQAVNGLDFPLDPLCNDLQSLFDQRVTALLEERGVRYDLIDAALSGGATYSSVVYGLVRRGEALQQLSSDDRFVPTVQAGARVANILRSAGSIGQETPVPGKEAIHGGAVDAVERSVSGLENASRLVDQSAFVEESERALFDTAHRLVPEVARRASDYDYAAVFETLNALNPSVNRFFDDVMVMVEDPAVRRNRLALLTFVDCLYKSLADFTRVVVA